MDDLDLVQLRTFKVIIEEGTFDSAAIALQITQSAVSQRMKALEAAVGRVLLQRTKPVTPTESGRELLLLARQMELLTADFAERLDGGATGSLQHIPLAVNADSLGTWMLAALAPLSDIATFEIHREDEEYSTALLHDGTVMAAVTSASQPVAGCRSVRLGKMRYRPFATRAFIERWFPNGPTAAALANAPVVMFDRKDEMQTRYIHKHTRRQAAPPRHYVPSTADFATAVLNGMGWGYISDIQMKTLGRDQNLAEFDPGSTLDVTLYWQQWKLSTDTLDHVASTIYEYAKTHLRQ